MAENEDSSSRSLQRKPLFAAAGLFPSASVITNESTAQEYPEDETENEGLESLKLDLAPSTLDAIIAAQKPIIHVPEPRTPEYDSSDEAKSDDEDQKELTHKRKHLSSPDSDGIGRDSSPESKKRSKEKHKKKKKKHKHKKNKHTTRSLSPEPSLKSSALKIPTGAVFLDDIKDLKPEHAFHIDRKSNKDLWHYESVSKMHIAKFRSFSNNCLGAPHLSSRDRKKENSKTQQKIPRYFRKEGVKQIRKKGVECMSGAVKTSNISSQDFIGFPKDANASSLGTYSCLDEATARYVQGKDAGYSAQPEDKTDDFLMDEIFEKVRHFNERTRDEPHNVQLWLDFVQFQDVVAQEDKSFKGQTIRLREVYQPSKSVIEKKLAILGKALEENPSSLELKLAQLELYQDIWESDKLEKAWEDLLFTHSANVDLWRQYLSNQQSQLFKFSFNRVVKCFHKCFKTLVPILDGQVKALNKRENMEEKMIGLFAQYCDFLHQSGYTERAVSSYQAMIEFNLFCPPSLNLSSSRERVKTFEDFWESGVARFGEKEAKGWTKWSENQDNSQCAAPVSVSTEEQEDAILLEKLPRSQTWLKMERARHDAHWLPWRPDVAKGETEENCEDLDRLVLFDDISPAIFRLTKSESCIRIVCLFLKFLGLSSETLDRKLSDSSDDEKCLQFVQYSGVSLTQFPALAHFKCGVDVESNWKPHECLLTFVREVLLQAEAYFILSNRVVFTQLRMDLEVLKTGVHTISELSKSDAKELKKFGKNLLKESQNRNNLVIWDSYIRVLWACSDKIGETVSMVDTALSMFMGSTSLSDTAKSLGLCLLCRTYCHIMLNFDPLEHIKASGRHSPPGSEDKNQVIACLGALVENKKFKPNSKIEITAAYLLKIRKRFQSSLNELCDKLSQAAEQSVCDLIEVLVDCFALFEFCAANFKTANTIYESTQKNIDSLSHNSGPKHTLFRTLQRHLYLSQISFITNVMHISLIPLSDMRQVLSQALQDFPNCPQLHATFLELEAGSHLAGRLRKFYEMNLKTPSSVIVPLFAVMSEMMRHQTVVKALDVPGCHEIGIPDSGVVHRIRSVLEHALQSRVSSHSPLLWRLYIMFEAKHGSMNRAKGIFYRALQSCPWAKCLYMDGIAVFGDSELQEMMDLMTEEEIRVRMPLEEVDLLLTAEKEETEEQRESMAVDEIKVEKSELDEEWTEDRTTGNVAACDTKAEPAWDHSSTNDT